MSQSSEPDHSKVRPPRGHERVIEVTFFDEVPKGYIASWMCTFLISAKGLASSDFVQAITEVERLVAEITLLMEATGAGMMELNGLT